MLTERVAVSGHSPERCMLLKVCRLTEAVKFTHEWRCRSRAGEFRHKDCPGFVVSGDAVPALLAEGVLAPFQWVVKQACLVLIG